MSFRLLILTEDLEQKKVDIEDWPSRLTVLVPGIEVDVCDSTQEAMAIIQDADAAYGTIGPALFKRARKLRWVCSPWAGPKAGYYHQQLIESDVTVTNARGIFNDHISAHIMAFVLAFARGLHLYIPRQLQSTWRPGVEPVHLSESVAVMVGVGGIGAEAAKLCTGFGMEVLGIDARLTEAPTGIAELHPPESLQQLLQKGDFVIVTVPETPATQGMFGAAQFQAMKKSSFFINIGRGATVVLNDLNDALESGSIAGAGLDVFQEEPLPSEHPLWKAPGMLITPHVAGSGPHIEQRRAELFLDNCVRFSEGRPLRNVVDKANWF